MAAQAEKNRYIHAPSAHAEAGAGALTSGAHFVQ